METLDYDFQVFSQQSREADKNLAVRFFVLPMKDEEASAKEGRPIFKDVVHVEIRVRGDRNNIVHQPVDENIKRRFPEAWRAYQQGEELVNQGTPLAEWPSMSKSMVEEMKYFGFYTVEHIANARDDVISRFPGLRSIQQKAKAFLELAAGNAPLERLHAELEKRDSTIAAQKAQMEDLAARLAELEKSVNK